MKIKEMNEALQWLRDKYAVKADGTLTATAPDFIGAGAELKLADGTGRKTPPVETGTPFRRAQKTRGRQNSGGCFHTPLRSNERGKIS